MMSLAGLAMLALAAAALLHPALIRHFPGGALIGFLLLLGGLVEMVAGSLRRPRPARRMALAAAGVTVLAGLLFLANPYIGLFPVSYVVTGWLLLRAVLLWVAASHSAEPVKAWTLLVAIADLLLGLILIVGLPVAALVGALFGPTPEIVASFTLILAASFAVSGIALLAIARLERADEFA